MTPRSLQVRLALACIVLALVPLGSAAPTSTAAATEIILSERSWGRGSVPSLTFALASGRGTNPKVAVFLYTSQLPDAFHTHTFPPQFVGVFQPPTTVRVHIELPPFRARPVDEFTRECFVQGAVFDAVTGAPLQVTNEDYVDIEYETPPAVQEFAFNTEDDFTTALVNGQDLSTPDEFNQLFSISSLPPVSGPPHLGPAIFDTTKNGPNAGSSDPDLLVGLGNAIILQENPGQTVPGIFDLPDDSANGGVIVFEFARVAPTSIDLIDVDAGNDVSVIMYDVLGRERKYYCPPNWTGDRTVNGDPGYRTLDLTTLRPQPGFGSTAIISTRADFLPGEVVRMEVVLSGSGAIDNLVIEREGDPTVLPLKGGTLDARPVRKLR